jgi:hypothetical protein
VSRRIASNSRNNIGVIDCLSKNFQGRIIVLDQEGGIKNIYTGHPDVNHGNKLFCPTGIVTTPSDKIGRISFPFLYDPLF